MGYRSNIQYINCHIQVLILKVYLFHFNTKSFVLGLSFTEPIEL